MKLAATLIAFVAAQAPPASKTCPDCQVSYQIKFQHCIYSTTSFSNYVIEQILLLKECFQDWHGAARTLVEAKPHLVQEWAIAAGKEQCQVIWEDDALCRYFVGGGFINWAESWLKRMDASSWCSAYTMCAKKARPGFMGEISEMADSCSSCKNFFGDYLAIAKHAPKQFHDIFIQVHFQLLDCEITKLNNVSPGFLKHFSGRE